MVGDDLGHLVLSHPGEAEHPDLRSDVEKYLMVQEGFVDDPQCFRFEDFAK